MKAKQKTARRTVKGFTNEEKSAMQQRVKELQTDTTDGESVVLATLAGMTPADRALGERIHAIVMANVPGVEPKLWYGMPAYAKDGKTVCHFQPAQKFKTRYATLGFSDKANLDEGAVWPVAFALTKLTGADEATIGALVKKAAS